MITLIAQAHLPDQDADIILGARIVRDGEDARPHGDLIVDLNEP